MTNQEIAQSLLTLFGENGEGWCQGSFAKKAGKPALLSQMDEADQYCLAGGILHLSLAPEPSFYRNFPTTLVRFNDSHSWEEIKSALLAIVNR